jgi:hypothetical protein
MPVIVYLLAYPLMVLVGGFSIFIIARVFSVESPNFTQCLKGAAIAEFVDLFNIPLLPSIVLFFVLVQLGGFRGMPALFAVILYGIVKLLIFGTVVVVLAGIFG